ncbi:hypothetical protein LCGC14_2939980, partial [marine sediment metagenome]
MLQHFWKVLSRNLIRNPVYSTINIMGFTIGITCSLLIYLLVLDELTFEEFHPDADRISRVLTLKMKGNEIVKTPITVMPLANAIKNDFPQIENATFINYHSSIPLEWNGGKIEALPAYIDESFFDVFSGFEFIEGNKETALINPGSVIISGKLASKLFGNEPALGNTLVSNAYGKQIFIIGGVVQIPLKSHINFDLLQLAGNKDFIGTYLNDWGSNNPVCTYI